MGPTTNTASVVVKDRASTGSTPDGATSTGGGTPGGGGSGPTGTAGGVLSGSYPNPGLNAGTAATDLASYFDALGAAAAALTAAEAFATTAANTAQANAEAASDPSGSAGTAQSNAESYALALLTAWKAINAGALQIGENKANSSNPGSLTLGPIGYATGGNIQIGFQLGAYDTIVMTTGSASFSPSGSAGLVAGRVQIIDIGSSNVGGTSLTWPSAWQLTNGSLPSSVAQNSWLRVILVSSGTTEAGVIASYFSAASISGITQLTGDVTAGPGSGSQATTLATVNTVTPGSYPSSAARVPTLTVNGKGLVTASGDEAIAIAASQVSGLPAAITGLTGDVTASGPGSVAATLATVNTSSPGSYPSSAARVPTLTVNGKGLVTASGDEAIAIAATQVSGLPTSLPPSGSAGGVLSGSYPNPTLNASTAEAELGLGSAAYQNTSAFDASGSAATAQSNAETYAAGLVTALNWIPPVKSFSFLRALSAPTSITACLVLSNQYPSNLGDGGQGIFVFDPNDSYSHDDGGTILVPGGSAPVVTSSTGAIATPGTAATVGAWHRLGTEQWPLAWNQGIFNIQWFGAAANRSTDCAPAIRLAWAAIQQGGGTSGCIYIPSGQYLIGTKVVIDMGLTSGTLSIKGDGPGATLLFYGLQTADTCMIEIKHGYGFGNMQDLSINQRYSPPGAIPLAPSPSILWIHDTTDFTLQNVQLYNCIATSISGGQLLVGPNDNQLSLVNVYVKGGAGVAYHQEGNSVDMVGCKFNTSTRGAGTSAWVSGTIYSFSNYVTYSNLLYYCIQTMIVGSTTSPASDTTHWQLAIPNTPCAVVGTSSVINSSQWSDSYFGYGGPMQSYTGCTVSGNGTTTTVTLPSGQTHSFIAGDYVCLAGVTNPYLSSWWYPITIVSSSEISFPSSFNGSDTGTLSSLWCSVYLQRVTECEFDSLYTDTSGAANGVGNGNLGMVSFYLDAFNAGAGAAIGQLSITNSLCDFGGAYVFAHGVTNSDPGSNCSILTISNLRSNTGPRDTFGSLRLVGCTDVVVNPGSNLPSNNGASPNWVSGGTYTVGQYVNNGGSVYGCIANVSGSTTAPGSDGTHWQFCTISEFDIIVISDGNQSYKTQDITITGGMLTNKKSTSLCTGYTYVGVVWDGANVYNVSVVNSSVDAATTPASLVNRSGSGTASLSNGLTMLFGNNAGRLNLIDSSRGIGGASL